MERKQAGMCVQAASSFNRRGLRSLCLPACGEPNTFKCFICMRPPPWTCQSPPPPGLFSTFPLSWFFVGVVVVFSFFVFYKKNFCCKQHFLRIAPLIQSAQGRKAGLNPAESAWLHPSVIRLKCGQIKAVLDGEGLYFWILFIFFQPRSVLMPYRWGNVSRQVVLPLCWFSPLPVTVSACLSSPPASALAGVKQQLANK